MVFIANAALLVGEQNNEIVKIVKINELPQLNDINASVAVNHSFRW